MEKFYKSFTVTKQDIFWCYTCFNFASRILFQKFVITIFMPRVPSCQSSLVYFAPFCKIVLGTIKVLLCCQSAFETVAKCFATLSRSVCQETPFCLSNLLKCFGCKVHQFQKFGGILF